jgi:hypothetical protein
MHQKRGPFRKTVVGDRDAMSDLPSRELLTLFVGKRKREI